MWWALVHGLNYVDLVVVLWYKLFTPCQASIPLVFTPDYVYLSSQQTHPKVTPYALHCSDVHKPYIRAFVGLVLNYRPGLFFPLAYYVETVGGGVVHWLWHSLPLVVEHMGSLMELVGLTDAVHACNRLYIQFFCVLADGHEGAVVVFIQKYVALRHAFFVLFCLGLWDAEDLL